MRVQSFLEAYFPDFFTKKQWLQLEQLPELYTYWNSQLNLISKADMPYFLEHHILHSLLILKFFNFKKNKTLIDIGTGGGLPGIPLAIALPEISFTLVDSIAKKTQAVQNIITELSLSKVRVINSRVENLPVDIFYDIVTARAVAKTEQLLFWTRKLVHPQSTYLFLKGGDLKEDLPIKQNYKIHLLKDVCPIPFFETKKILEIKPYFKK